MRAPRALPHAGHVASAPAPPHTRARPGPPGPPRPGWVILRGMSEPRYDIPPERLERWLDRWTAAHGAPTHTQRAGERIEYTAADGAVLVAEPPFPPVPRGNGFGPLLAHVARDRVVGVLLVRLNGHAAGVFAGRRLVAARAGQRPVHGRHRAGGQSQRRYERRREGEARVALEAAADLAAAVLLPHLHDLEAVVLGGDRRALGPVMEDRRLRPLARLAVSRVLDVPDPRPAVLRAAPDAFLATVLRPRDADPAPAR
jgi:Actinobacteria/chloroflexi VLRF1 release factor